MSRIDGFQYSKGQDCAASLAWMKFVVLQKRGCLAFWQSLAVDSQRTIAHDGAHECRDRHHDNIRAGYSPTFQTLVGSGYDRAAGDLVSAEHPAYGRGGIRDIADDEQARDILKGFQTILEQLEPLRVGVSGSVAEPEQIVDADNERRLGLEGLQDLRLAVQARLHEEHRTSQTLYLFMWKRQGSIEIAAQVELGSVGSTKRLGFSKARRDAGAYHHDPSVGRFCRGSLATDGPTGRQQQEHCKFDRFTPFHRTLL